MYGYIYKTTNLINGKIYIGQHKAEEFDSTYKGSGTLLQEAIKKYGKENFKVQLIKECFDRNDLDYYEVYYIDKFNSRNLSIGYNITQGGQTKFFTGMKHSKESKIKMSSSAKNHKHLATTSGKIWIHKDTKNKVIYPEELNYYIEQGYMKGRYYAKPVVAWNKGLDKSDLRIQKIVKTRKATYGYNSDFMLYNNPNRKTDEYLMDNIINKGFYEYWLENGKWYTAKKFSISLATVDRCLKLIGKEETIEHKNYIRNKNRK